MSAHRIRFPGETPTYRAARDKLLDAEIEVRRATEKVAAQRRGWRQVRLLSSNSSR